MRVFVILLCLLSLCAPVLADSAASDEDAKLAQLENQTRARELYLAGDAASKKGDLETAIWDWAQALQVKPDSQYTAKGLAQAREKLYGQYLATVSAKADAKDPITAYERANALSPLMPDRKELAERAERLKASLTDDQKKALAAYEEGQSALAQQDYIKASTALTTAQTFDREAVCIKQAISRLEAFRAQNPQLFAAKTVTTTNLPRIVYIYATWCHYCKMMDPMINDAESKYVGKLTVTRIDGDKNRQAKQYYKVKGFPTTVFLDKDGHEFYRLGGYVDPQDWPRVLQHVGLE